MKRTKILFLFLIQNVMFSKEDIVIKQRIYKLPDQANKASSAPTIYPGRGFFKPSIPLTIEKEWQENIDNNNIDSINI